MTKKYIIGIKLTRRLVSVTYVLSMFLVLRKKLSGSIRKRGIVESSEHNNIPIDFAFTKQNPQYVFDSRRLLRLGMNIGQYNGNPCNSNGESEKIKIFERFERA